MSIGRERRRSEDVHAALLASAAKLFARHGLARTTTKEIAEDAGVAETAVFRHFGSKTDLFRAAVVAPFVRFVDHYAERWLPIVEEPASHEALLRAFMEDLHDELVDNHDAMLAMMMAQVDPSAQEAVAEGREHFAQLCSALTSLAETLSSRSDRYTPVFTDALTSRFIVGMLMLFTTFDSWFTPPGGGPITKAQIVDTMAGMVIPGLAVAQDGKPAEPSE